MDSEGNYTVNEIDAEITKVNERMTELFLERNSIDLKLTGLSQEYNRLVKMKADNKWN